VGKKDGKKLSDGVDDGVGVEVTSDDGVGCVWDIEVLEVGNGLALTGRWMWSVGFVGTSVGRLATSTLVVATDPVVVS
jgi:hypothetical protein